MNKVDAMKKPASAYEGLGDMLAGGFDQMLTSAASEQTVKLDDIEILAQVREEFEEPDDEHSLASLGKSLRKQQLQAILLRPNTPGSAKPYLLVAGERRVRGARIEGLTELRAVIQPMTDEEAEDAQFAENIHRKNLTQIEEAKRIQRDLDQLGGIDEVLAKHNKGRAWLSKILSLLQLPEQAKRLVQENVSADIELINTVKTIEKADPVKAKALVDDLKQTRGKENARAKAAAVKEVVKPSKKQKETEPEKTPAWLEAQRARDAERVAQGGVVATPKDRTQEQPSAGDIFTADIFAGAKNKVSTDATDPPDENGSDPAEVLHRAYVNIFEFGSEPKTLLDVMQAEDKNAVDALLYSFYEAGKQAKDAGRAVIQGFRNGQFSRDGSGAFALVAFLHGADSAAKFSLLNIFGAVKE